MKTSQNGSCHCGAIQFTVSVDVEGERNAICNCSRCQMIGFLHHHVESSSFNLVSGWDHIQTYRFATLGAEHMFCKSCGIEPFYRSRSDPNKIDVNLRCLQGIDIYALQYSLVDGRHWEEAQAARRKFEEQNTAPPKYSLLSIISEDWSPEGEKAFFDSWH